MRTPEFVDLVLTHAQLRNSPDTEYSCLFFGYSESFKRDHEWRRWQAALLLADLGATAVGDRFRYHLYIADTSEHGGVCINTISAAEAGGPLEIPGLIEGEQASINISGEVQVIAQGHALQSGSPGQLA